METIHVRAVIQPDGSLHLDGLPFSPGEEVEVTLQSKAQAKESSPRLSLKGTVLKYIDPTEPVAEDDWDALR
jgi:hypothetical protein